MSSYVSDFLKRAMDLFMRLKLGILKKFFML